MSSYIEHVTRALATDLEHPALGTVAVLTFAPPEGQERRPATLGPQSIDVVTGAISDALDRADAGEIGAIAMARTVKGFLAGADLSMFTDPTAAQKDRKSTRLNSSHVAVSSAVFCLTKTATRLILVLPST